MNVTSLRGARQAALPRLAWRRIRAFDWPLLAGVVGAVCFGMAMIYSATLRGDPVASLWDDLVVKQAVFAVISLCILLMSTLTDYRALAALWMWLYGGMVGILLLVAGVGQTQLGSQRWLTLGLADLQPSEFVKVGVVVCLAAYFARFDIRKGRHVIGSLTLVAIPMLLVFLQPNLSTTILLGAIWLGMAFAAGLRMLHFALLALLAGPTLFAIQATGLLRAYHLDRISAWLDPMADPMGDGYQNIQTLIAVGNGGVFGIGYAQGLQAQGGWLPLLHTDNIFALIAEELGFAGAAFVLAMLAFIVMRVLRAARAAQDPTGALICIGIGVYVLSQTLVNVGVVLQILPVTGLSLPFISYGGSSMAALMLAIGLVQSVRMRRRPLAFGE